MNIKFIVLSCDKYLDTRCKAQKNSFLRYQKKIFITDSSIFNSDDIIGYDTPKNYDGIQQKYISFFKNYDFNESDYYFCIDDDTFVNLNNLKKMNLPRKDKKFCIHRICYLDQDAKDYHGYYTGYPLNKITGIGTELPIMYPSGGSGFILSKSACIAIQGFLKSITDEQIPRSGHSDVTIGFWMRMSNIELIQTDNFWFDVPEKLYKHNYVRFDSIDEENAITYHYVSEDTMYNFDKKYNINHYEI